MSQKKNYYAVAKGHAPGIYSQWSGPDGAEAQIKGYSGARFQGFATRAEAEAWLSEQQSGEAPAARAASSLPQVPSAASPKHADALAAG